MTTNGPFLYPNVSSVPRTQDLGTERSRKSDAGAAGEFGAVMDRVEKEQGVRDLNQVREPLKFSAHASQRLRDRKIALDPQTMAKVNNAVDQAEAKGIEESLVLTPDAALIVSVKNRTVITALDRASMSGNVFTNIDGAVIV